MKSFRYLFLLVLAGCWATPLFAADDPNLIAPTDPISPAEQKKMFHLPPGFEIELVVSEPMIGQPTNIAFDAAGRLWINSTLEYPYPAEGKPRDRVQYMEDTDKDGVPDKIHTFAEGLNIPIGLAPLRDSLLCYSIPTIDRFRDTDGDGKADQRDTLYGNFGYRDTHGMASSFRPWIDGWIYACHGFANDSRVKGGDQTEIAMNSGNTYRFRADGSHIEQRTWGQVNPYGLAFNAWGDIFSSDCHTKPAYMLLTGAYYPSFGKPHDGLGYGPEMMQHLHGSTGIAGIVVYEATQFPKEFQNNLLIGNPVTGRINRDSLSWKGASPTAHELPDFVSCDDRWFRPVDLALATDGSIYVADFYNCIIGHYEVPLPHPRRDREHGRIWRITYRGTPGQPANKIPVEKDLTQLTAAELVERLAAPNITTRVFATNELVERLGTSALPALEPALSESSEPIQRAHALWAIERLRGLTSDEIRRLANDTRPIVRAHLFRALSERPVTDESVGTLFRGQIAVEKHARVQHSLVDALARHPHLANIELLLDVWRATPAEDTHLIHATRISLRDNLQHLGDIVGIARSLGSSADVAHRLADVSVGCATPSAAEFLSEYLAREDRDIHRQAEYLHHAARYASPEVLARLVERSAEMAPQDVAQQTAILRALSNAAQERGKSLAPKASKWGSDLAHRLIADADAGRCRQGIELARDLRMVTTKDLLVTMAAKASPHRDCRTLALESLAQIDPKEAIALSIKIVEDANDSLDVRNTAAELLGKLKEPTAVPVLARWLGIATGPFLTFTARGLSWTDAGADALLSLLESGKAPPELLNDPVVSHELQFRAAPNKDQRLAQLKANIPTPDQAIRELIAQRQGAYQSNPGDAGKGEAVFVKNCGICHQIAGKGAKIGPQLDGVGIRGAERIMEDTLDPDRNVDQAFRKRTIVKTDGSVVAGLLLRREGESVVLADAQGKEVRLSAADIEQEQESKLSPMPSDVARGLPPGDFNDLLAFLLSQRAPVQSP